MQNELQLDTNCARCLWAIDATKWLGAGSAFWLEWQHPNEGSRSFSSIIGELEAQQWPKLIPPGSTCIDIGAHSGDTTIAMGLFSYDKFNNKKGHVIAVEPNPDLGDLLKLCLTINSHLANFIMENCAITETNLDEVALSDHGNSNCNGGIIGNYSASLKNTLQQYAKTTYKVRGKSLSSLVSDHRGLIDPRSICFIKTDCEGFDKEILRSSVDFLNQIKPALFIEWFAWFTPEDDENFFSAIDDCGYIPLHPYTMERIDRTQRLPDLICIHKTLI